ncbi:MAG: class F sortase [Anaerolineae bacterium]|nr:class F sortase [Anaerolineae bacterium]
MQLKLIAFGLLGSLLGGACAMLMMVLLLLGHRWLLKPDSREAVVLGSPVTPILIPTIPPLIVETPVPLADAPPVETPEALLPTVTPERVPINPVLTPTPQQESAPIAPTAAAPPLAATGQATRLVIPAIGLDTWVVPAPRQGDSWQVDHLGQIVGHLENTAAPGSSGNIVLAGHYTLEETRGGPGPFYKLKGLVPGDVVTVYRGEERFDYIVDGFQTVDEKAVDVTYSTGTARLTLLTCTQWDRNRGEYLKRLIVRAHLL